MAPGAQKDEVVVSGVGGRLPECDNLEEFRDALFSGKDVITDNAQRWKPGRLGLTGRTGKVSGIDRFDAVFFGMHRKLTDATDPLSRIIMERVFEAIVDAGINPHEIRGTRTAVFIGSALSESENIFIQTTAEDGFGIMGHNRSMMANRVSYYFDFKGPSYAVDTSFCSGLGALELGKRAIDSGEVDMAIVGTATLSFHPEITQHFHDIGQISEDGITRPFSKHAQGWARSEAAICMLLQRKSAAHRVYASVLHVKVKKFDEDLQKPLLQLDHRHFVRHFDEFYSELKEETGIVPEDIDYLEAEGCGFKELDEMEMQATDLGLCARRSTPLLTGSTMGQVGHCEASSGLAALCKVLVALEEGVVPATLNVTQDEVNPNLRPIVEGRLRLVTEATPLPAPALARGALVAVNNFGVANLFGHAVLRGNPKSKVPPAAAADVIAVGGAELRLEPVPRIVFVSARNEENINSALDLLHAKKEADPEYCRLMHDVYTTNTYGHLQRAYTFVPQSEALTHEVAPHGGARRPIWFVYSGMGSQWPGMARHLLRVPVFRAALQRCHDALLPHGVDLLHIVTTDDPTIYDNILHSFVGIAAVQVGLTDVLHALGIQPDGIIGHSVGELGCGYADGCFSAEQMVLAAHARGRASIETELIQGYMAAVGLGYSEVKPMLPESIEVACRNSNTSCTISGPADDVHKFVAKLKADGIFAKAVNVSNIAYHSQYIKPAGPKLLHLLRDVLPEPRPRSQRWVSTSVLEERWAEPLAQTSSAEYHTNNLLSPVFFEEGSRKIPKDAICIEIAPHGLLQAILRRSLDANVTNIPLTRRDVSDGAIFLMESIGRMYLAGLNPKVQNLYEPVEYPVSRGTAALSPLVKWDHSEVWYTGRYSQQTSFIPAEKHIPVRALDPVYAPYRDCVWEGRIIITPANCLEKVVEMIYRINDEEEVPIVFEDVQFYHIVDMPVVEEALVYVLYQRGSGHFEMSVDMRVVARGRAQVPMDGAKALKKMWARQPPSGDEGRVVMDQDEVYDELRRRGVGVDGKLKAIKQVVVSPTDVLGRVANHSDRMLLLDSLLQLYTLLDSESMSELRVPHRIRQILLDPDRSALHEDADDPEQAEQGGAEQEGQGEQGAEGRARPLGPPLSELVFRLHRASATLRCANIEVRGVATRPFGSDKLHASLAVDLEQFIVHGEQPAPLQRPDEMVAAAIQMATQQMALQPLSRTNTETLVGLLGVDAQLEEMVHDVGKRVGKVLARRVLAHEASECDLLVAGAADAAAAAAALASHAVLLAQLPPQPTQRLADAHVLLQQQYGPARLVLFKKAQPAQALPPQVVEVERASQLQGLLVPPVGVTYVVWRSLPEQGIPALLKDIVRQMPGAHRIRSLFLLDATAPKFSPSHPFYAGQLRLGLAASVLLHGAWGNLYLRPRQLVEPVQPSRHLAVNRLEDIPDLDVDYLGLNGAVMEPTNLEVRDGYILDIKWVPTEKQPRGAGVLDYAATRRADGVAVMGVMDAASLSADPVLRWAVPTGWALEDAATVPYAYAMAYFALVHTGSLQAGERVLVHDGWSAIGQAAIDVALALGCPVHTTYRTDEEKSLIQQRFPELPANSILSLQGERFERDLAVLMSDQIHNRQRRGVRFVLSNLGGEGLFASLRALGMYGRIVQLTGNDAADGVRMGMSLFIKSIGFFGLDPTSLARCPEETRRTVHALVQAGLDAGVVRPIERTVLPASHVKQAVSYLDGDCTDKVVLEVRASKGPTAPAPAAQRYQCDEKASYLVVGGCRSHALHTVEWLLSRGARCVLLGGLQDPALSQVTLRRLALMRARWGAHVTTVPGVRADTAQGAATLLGRAANMAPLAAVFVLPLASAKQDEAVQALDGVLRGPGPSREAVLLVAVELGAPSSRVAAACAARRRAGGRAALVGLNVAEPHLRILAMDNALADPQPVLHVNVKTHDPRDAESAGRLRELLPRSREALEALGRSVRAGPRSSQLPSAFGGVLAKSREVPDAFLVAGLGGAPDEEMGPLAGALMASPVLLMPAAEHHDVQSTAAQLVAEALAHQLDGPYTLVARGWAGCVGLEMARLLEARGQRVALMLLDCPLSDLQATVWALGKGDTLQAWLLCSLLHLPPSAYDELESLPSWPARLERALALRAAEEGAAADALAALAAGLDVVYARLCALADYRVDFTLHQTVITLIRPVGAEADDLRGLDKMSTLPVQVAVLSSSMDSPDFWREAACTVSKGVYVGSKPMHLSVIGSCKTNDTLWCRLR